LTTKDVYDMCGPYTDVYFKAYYIFHRFWLLQKYYFNIYKKWPKQKQTKNTILQKRIVVNFFSFLENVLFGVYTNYIKKMSVW